MKRAIQRLALFVLAAYSVALASAETFTKSYGGVNVSMTLSYNETTGKVAVAWNTNGPQETGGQPWTPGAWLYRLNSEGGSVNTVIFDMAPAGPYSNSFEFDAVPGTWFRVGLRVSSSGIQWWTVSPDVVDEWEAGGEPPPPPTYGITLKVPANGTTRAVLYMAIQNGQSVGSYNQPSGASAADWYIGGLDTNDAVHLVEITGGFIEGNPGVSGPGGAGLIPAGGSNPETEYVPVAPGAAPSTETSPGAGATATSSPTPTAPTQTGAGVGNTPTTAPTAPTPTSAPTAPTATTPVAAPTLPTNPTPTGTDLAKKEDVMSAANQVTNAVNVVSTQVTASANKIIEATDKVASSVVSTGTKQIEATDKVATAVSSAAVKAVEAANKSQGTLDEINTTLKSMAKKESGDAGLLGNIGTKLDTTNAKLDAVNTNAGKIADNTEALLEETKKLTSPSNVTGGNFNTAGALSTAETAAGSSEWSGIAVSGTSVTTNISGSSDGLLPTASLHVGDRDITLGALSPTLNEGANVLKAARPLLLLALCVWFVWSCSSTIEAYVVGLGHIGGGGAQNVVGVENAVPGVGQAKHLASATAIATVGLAAGAAVVALVDTIGGNYGLSIGGMLTAFNYPNLGGAVAWADNYVPVAASTSLVILRAAVGYMCAPIYLGAATLARFLHV